MAHTNPRRGKTSERELQPTAYGECAISLGLAVPVFAGIEAAPRGFSEAE